MNLNRGCLFQRMMFTFGLSVSVAVVAPVIASAFGAGAFAAEYILGPDGKPQKIPTSRLPDVEEVLAGERCYGVTRRGDEQGLTLPPDFPNPTRYRPQDGDNFAWIELPFGICERLAGGSLVPSTNTEAALEELRRKIDYEDDDGKSIEGNQDLIEDRINDFLYQ